MGNKFKDFKLNVNDETLNLILIIQNIFLISIYHLNPWIMFSILAAGDVVLIVLLIRSNKNSKETGKNSNWSIVIASIFIALGLWCAFTVTTASEASNLITYSIFFLLIFLTAYIVISSINFIFNPEKYYVDESGQGEPMTEAVFNVWKKAVDPAKPDKLINEEAAKKYVLKGDVAFPMLFYKIMRTIALAAFIFSNLWILSISPFSFFGGSLYGGIMQVILASGLGLLMFSFWVNANTLGLGLVTAGCFATYMLSFMFPTLFANLWVISTTSSASAGASTVSSFSSISPMSYYKSTYIVRTGQTEKRMGPTYELISDEVVGLRFSVLGRMCDESILVASVNIQNLAKFELKDLSVQLSALRSPYCFGAEEDPLNICNICGVSFTDPEGKGSSYTEPIKNLPKGVPRTVNVPFTTWLPADVMNMVCRIRSNVLVHYHTTSVFPLSFIDYNAYLISPKNIGNPLSTSSFGKVLLSVDVGQQPVVVNEKTQINDQVLLKMAWSQKGGGVVNSPKIVLYLPQDLGSCEKVRNSEISYRGSMGFAYTGIYGYNRDKTTLFKNTDFNCKNFLNQTETNVTTFCDTIFSEGINPSLNTTQADVKKSIIYFTPKYESSFQGMPSFNDACEDLSTKGYTVCVADSDLIQNDILLCPLNLGGIDVSEVDLSTYLIRADALYSFNNIKEDQFTVENCNAI